MIKKSILTAILIFIVYSIFIVVNKRNLSHAQYNYQENIIKADLYLYDKNVPNVAIIGSSLASRINADSLPGYYNLSLYGMGVFDGAGILLKRDKLPPLILIEINYFYKPENQNFKNSFDNKPMGFLKQKLPAMRDENQPLGLSYGAIRDFLNLKSAKQNTDSHLDKKVFDTLLAGIRGMYLHPDTMLINKGMFKLKKYVQTMNKMGSKVYFFEMPINSDVEMFPLSVLVRNAILKNFPQNSFIPAPKQKFVTMDGVHLGYSEAQAYTTYFKNSLKLIATRSSSKL